MSKEFALCSECNVLLPSHWYVPGKVVFCITCQTKKSADERHLEVLCMNPFDWLLDEYEDALEKETAIRCNACYLQPKLDPQELKKAIIFKYNELKKIAETCSNCGGKGKVIDTMSNHPCKCYSCKGTGKTNASD